MADEQEILRQRASTLLKYQYQNRRAKSTLAQLSSPTGLLVEGTVLRSLREQGFSLSTVTDNKSVYDPSQMFVRLGKYVRPNILPDVRCDEYSSSVWNQAYDVTLRAFVGEDGASVEPLGSRQDMFAALKFDKASGAPEFSSKELTHERDFERMLKWLDNRKAAEPCIAYHRIQHGEKGPKTRLVWGYPTMITLAEAKYARPLIQHFLKRVCPMAFGVKRFQLGARLMQIENMGIRYGFDFSGFDSTITPQLIAMAFSVLRHLYPASSTIDAEWEKIVNYFIHTPILMPDGYVYQKHTGVPSGSYFTQLIDSIVNYFSIQYASIKLTCMAIDDGRVLVLGDDSILGLPGYYPIEQWQKVFQELGLVLNSSKSGVWKQGEDVHFLGHSWHYGIVDRDPVDVAKRMTFPERRSGIEDARKRIVTRVYAYVSDAISAHGIIYDWSRYKGSIPGVYSRQIETSYTGWQELQDTVFGEEPELVDAYTQACIGILR